LRPFFPPIRGVRPHAFKRQRRLTRRPVHALPAPGDPFHLVVLGQAGLPYLQEKPLPLPALEVGVHGAGAAVLLGQRLPLAAGAKHIDNRRKNLPCRHRLASCSGLALVLAATRPFSRWDQRPNLAPQRVRHRPRLYLCHLESYLRADPHATDNRIVPGNQPRHYLRISSKAVSFQSIDLIRGSLRRL